SEPAPSAGGAAGRRWRAPRAGARWHAPGEASAGWPAGRPLRRSGRAAWSRRGSRARAFPANGRRPGSGGASRPYTSPSSSAVSRGRRAPPSPPSSAAERTADRRSEQRRRLGPDLPNDVASRPNRGHGGRLPRPDLHAVMVARSRAGFLHGRRQAPLHGIGGGRRRVRLLGRFHVIGRDRSPEPPGEGARQGGAFRLQILEGTRP